MGLVIDSIHTGAPAAPVRLDGATSPDCKRRAELIAMMLDRFGATATNGQTKGEQSNGTAASRMTGHTVT